MTKMYSERTKNIAVFRGCNFDCVYCRGSFQRLVKMNKKCPDCTVFKPHTHLKVLQRTPPKTKEDEFLTVGLSSDVSFMKRSDFVQVIQYCEKWNDRTFLIQSKDPEYFLQFNIPDNVIICTTIETNISSQTLSPEMPLWDYNRDISKAPIPEKRYEAMLKLTCMKAITMEPALDFSADILIKWVKDIAPKFVYIGYDSRPELNHLPEPPLAKTMDLIARLEQITEVRRKLIRPAWYEGGDIK